MTRRDHLVGCAMAMVVGKETTRLHAISPSKTGWSSLTYNRGLHQAGNHACR
ncbi:unnamed protein product [Ascophyllum nodosum]